MNTGVVNVPTIDYDSIFSQIYHAFTSFDFSTWPGSIATFLLYYKFLSTIATFFLAIGILYCFVKLSQIRHQESLVYNAQLPEVYDMPRANAEMNKKWERIALHIESANSNDWKVAIIEADILLGDMLTEMGYQGESIGEKLQRVEKGDLATLDQAWEAHKVRNMIAHAGAAFEINQREAKRVIGMYEAVLNEIESRK